MPQLESIAQLTPMATAPPAGRPWDGTVTDGGSAMVLTGSGHCWRAAAASAGRGRWRRRPGSPGLQGGLLVLAGAAAAAVEAGGGGPAHLGGPAEAFEDADQAGGDVDLAGVCAVPGAGRIGMVHVVPALPEREQGQTPQVSGTVVAAGGERAAAEHAAQRVDAPGDMLQHGDAHQPRPQQRGQGGAPGTPLSLSGLRHEGWHDSFTMAA